MCMPGLPNGIPIEADIHEQYPDELKVAWKTFHNWWKKHFKGEPVYRAKMPPKVAEALEKITNAPIPTLEGYTGADSCYVIGVNMFLTD
jgi:hypothetical protein